MASSVVWSTLYLGNFQDIDSDESTRTIETSPEGAEYGSSTTPLYEYVTDVTTQTNDPNNQIFTNNETPPGTVTYDIGQGSQTEQLDSVMQVNGLVTFADGSTIEAQSLGAFQDTAGNLFLLVADNQTNLLQDAIVSFELTSVVNSDWTGHNHTNFDDNAFQETANQICFAAGTMIATPSGGRSIETLSVGDIVCTLDGGALPILWHNIGTQPLERVREDERPVLIQAEALGPGRPARDLIVSPQHRILVAGHGQLMSELDPVCDEEVLVPAKALTTLPGIRYMHGKRSVSWGHFVLETHQVVIADGCHAESLLLGLMALRSMTRRQRSRIKSLFSNRTAPEDALNGPPARRCLTVGQTQRALKRGALAKPTPLHA